jgi:hypothetical protein
MHRAPPWEQRNATPRGVVISVTLAITVHAAVLAWVSTNSSRAATVRPPAVQGTESSGSPDRASGMPASTRRNVHVFKVVDKDSDYVLLKGAVVRDVLGEQESVTEADGTATLVTQPAAKLVVQVEKPGYALHAERLANADTALAHHTIMLTPAEVPYAIVDTILRLRCSYCHGGAGKTEGVDIMTYNRVLASRSAKLPIVIPGKPWASPLIRVLLDSLGADGKRTPHARVTAGVPELEREYLTVWIQQGARFVGVP